MCPVVPIRIKLQGKNEVLETYAMLDNCSSSCFMNDKLLNKLGLKGVKPNNISMRTLTDYGNTSNTRVVNNLELYSYDNVRRDCLPVVFARELWPFDDSDLPDINCIRGEDHLKGIDFHFISADIGVLIGMNRPEMLKPLEVVSGPPNTIYATRHHLGWAINGLIKDQSESHRRCRFTTAATPEYLKGIENEIQCMYREDFRDEHVESDKTSTNDQKWLDLVENSLSVHEGHYQIRLPFANSNPVFPSNKRQIYYNFLQLKRVK